jgi:hypothetical protein
MSPIAAASGGRWIAAASCRRSLLVAAAICYWLPLDAAATCCWLLLHILRYCQEAMSS